MPCSKDHGGAAVAPRTRRERSRVLADPWADHGFVAALKAGGPVRNLLVPAGNEGQCAGHRHARAKAEGIACTPGQRAATGHELELVILKGEHVGGGCTADTSGHVSPSVAMFSRKVARPLGTR
jgi:hypothetical protein